MGRRASTALAALLLVACGDDASASRDASADSGADAGLAEGSPAEPVQPDLGPCPTGWRELPAEGSGVPPRCEPSPGGTTPTCGDDELWAPGDPACARVGPACPVDGLPVDVPADRVVVYVLAAAPAGGEGSRAAPFGTLAEGLRAAAPSRGVVALGRGRYVGNVVVPAGVAIVGACAADTVLTATVDTGLAVVSTTSAGAALRDVTVADGPLWGVIARGASAELTLENVVVRAVTGAGVVAWEGGTIRARSVAVRDTLPDAGRSGRGFVAAMGGSASLAHGALERNHEVAAYVGAEGSSLALEDVLVRGTLPDATGGGRGVGAETSGAATLSRCLLESNRETALFVSSGATVVADDVVVRDTESNAGGAARGLTVGPGGHAELDRTFFDHNREVTILATGADAALVARDLVVWRSEPRTSDARWGIGLTAERGGSVDVTRVVVELAHEVGVLATGAGSRLRAEDLRVSSVAAGVTPGSGGRILEANTGAAIELTRARLERGVEAGLVLDADATVATLRDVRVSGVTSRPDDGRYGDGLVVERAARVDAERILIEDVRRYGVLSFDGAAVTLVDAVVHDVVEAACGASCGDGAGGTALGAFGTAVISASRFRVERAALCGAHLAADGAIDLSDGMVSGCAVGACVQVDGFDTTRLGVRVLYVDNGRPLDTTMLPVPTALDAVSF